MAGLHQCTCGSRSFWGEFTATASQRLLTVAEADAYATAAVLADRQADTTRDGWAALYEAANKLMAYMGAYGSADARSPLGEAVMDALHDIDGGEYREGLKP